MQSHITRIALVDDHSLLRNGLCSLIDSFDDYKVVLEADNGRQFIDLVQSGIEPDIVLLDITMPVMNGYETAEWIRANKPSIRILVLSMMDNDAAIIRMLRCGAKGFMLKDSKPATFRQALNSIRDSGFYINDLVSGKMLHFVNNIDQKQQSSTENSTHLTDREIEFLKHACSEKTYKEIADNMDISPRTVDGYRDALFEKLGVTTRVGLVIYAIKNGIYMV